MRVVVTRAAAEVGAWVDELRDRGFDAVALPLIEIGAAPDVAPLDRAWSQIDSYRAAMFVSANAVRGFFAAKGTAATFSPRAWATGPGTRNALVAAGVAPEKIDSPKDDSPRFDSEALWSIVQPQCTAGGRVLLVRGGDGRDWLEQQLTSCGATVETIVAYSRLVPTWSPHEETVAASSADAVWLFSSSEAIANLLALLPKQGWRDALAVATHPRIAQTARDAGFGVVCESRPTLDDVARTLESLG
jgi:uroporphyrinogen-III synthase